MNVLVDRRLYSGPAGLLLDVLQRRLALRDFEDAMQVAAGIACGADVIATRNLRDYRGSPIEAVEPSALVKALS